MTVIVDIHRSKNRTERAKINLLKKFSENNAKITCKFLDRLRLENKSYGRIANYADCIGRILEIYDEKNISEWTREDIEFIHKTIADSNYENSVKKDTLTALKRICHYALHEDIADKAKGKEYDELVAWITPGSFKDRYQKIQPKDLLTDEEMLQLIQAAKRMGGKYVKRNIAIIFVLLEGAFRPGELLDIRISGIEFEKDFVRIHTTGKTGPKSLTLVASFDPIKEWLAEHPYSDNPNAFLFYHDNKDGLIPYHRLSELIKKAVCLILNSKKPLILVGNGCIRQNATFYVRKFAELTGICSMNTFMGKGVISDKSERHLKTIGIKEADHALMAVKEADLIISIGYDLVEYSPKFWNGKLDKKIIHIDFTPAETDTYYPPTVEIAADIELTIDSILLEMEKEKKKNPCLDCYPCHEMPDLFLKIKKEIDERISQYKNDATYPMKPEKLVTDVRDALDEKDVVISDVGVHKLWIAKIFDAYYPNTCIIPNGFCSMGFSVPGAIAAQLVFP